MATPPPTTNPLKRKRNPHPVHWKDLLSARSLPFYDGTYKWDGGKGYWDDRGVYHVFNDEEDEEGRPPTPGPVGAWLEDEEEEGGGEGEEVGLERGVEEGSGFDGEVGDEGMGMTMRKESPGEEKGGCGVCPVGEKMETEMEMESMTPVDKKMDTVTTADEKMDTVEPDALEEDDPLKAEDTQPAGPQSANVTSRNWLESSPLSDCPSDLSDWNVAQETEGMNPASDQDSERTETSDASGEIDEKLPKDKKIRGSSIDSGVGTQAEFPSRRRSERIFLKC